MSWYDNYFKINNIYSIPAIYGSMDFAQIVRNAFLNIKPDCIAVELPPPILKYMITAIKRLPYPSILTFGSNNHNYITIQPCDPAIEAIRLAHEYDTEIYFVDKDININNNHTKIYPDTYYASKINLKNFYKIYKKHIHSHIHKNIYLKELNIAQQLKQMAHAYKKILFICNIEHFEIITYLINKNHIPETPKEQKIYKNINLFHLDQNLYNNMLTTMPFITYLYELGRKNLNPLHLNIKIPNKKTHSNKDKYNEELFHEDTFSKAERLTKLTSSKNKIDTYDCLHEIITYTAKIYQNIYQNIKEPQITLTLKYARNYALNDNNLVPSPFQLITAAKNCINENFSNELLRVINFYPFQYNYNYLIPFDNNNTQKITPYLNTKPWITKKIPLKKQAQEKIKGLWQQQWKTGGLFSYPPEDINIENYFQYLRNKGYNIIKKQKNKNTILSNSLLDELDTENTIRNIHLNKIFVKEQENIKGSAGTVIIIFDHFDKNNKYSHTMTKHAENIHESDIALYSTPPGEIFVGPGISQVQYGGLMSVFPSKSIPNVWYDKQFANCKYKGNTLLFAGIHHADKKYIIYLANQEPDKYFKYIARKKGKQLIYIPLKQIPQHTINKIRTFHFISDNRLIKIANKYI